MYESRFGITGPPFQLTADPSFYFDSRGHHRALVELRRGLREAAGFTVVSGEIGAGKTTLVRTLLAELDPAPLAVAHVVSTQLNAGELLAAVVIGFGLQAGAMSPDELASQLLGFLRALDQEARRAVLIIDEAQNLHRDAFDQLLSLAARSAPQRLPLQVCLVGQPELRAMIDAADLAPLRRRVGVSCHLGPLDRDETGPYIEHRLQKVGWSGSPHFEAGAFDEVFRWTHGVPRRINLLCNRLMLSRFLAGETAIDVATVTQTARDLHAEIGEPGEPPAAIATPRQVPAATRGSVLCVVAGRSDHVKAAALMRAFAAQPELPPATLVRVHDNDALDVSRALFAGLDAGGGPVDLGLGDGMSAAPAAELTKAFALVVERLLPKAVIVFDGSDAAFAGATVARAKGVPVVHIGAGLRLAEALPGHATRQATDALADLLYTADAQASATLAAEGLPPERVHCVGNLLVDAMQLALRSPAGSTPGTNAAGPVPFVNDRSGYAVVLLNESVNIDERRSLVDLLAVLNDVRRDIALVWPFQARAQDRLRSHRLDGFLASERVFRTPAQPYADYLRLLRAATCVITDSWNVQEECTALGVPCLTVGAYPERAITVSTGSNLWVGMNPGVATRCVWDCIFNGGKRGRVPELWDGRTGARIAGYLGAWLLDSPSSSRDVSAAARNELTMN